jgi:hypothetical protein
MISRATGTTCTWFFVSALCHVECHNEITCYPLIGDTGSNSRIEVAYRCQELPDSEVLMEINTGCYRLRKLP